MNRVSVLMAVASFAALALSAPAIAAAHELTREELGALRFDQRLGEQVPLDLQFRDENGAAVVLSQYLDGSRPVILTLNYFHCQNLCPLELEAVANALNGVPFTLGDEIFPVGWALHGSNLLLGLPFSLTLMLILLAHEMGHYLFCVRYGVSATLPFFIPFPTLIGTLGAFIRIKSRLRSRAILFDIGISGPIAGFVVALVVSGFSTFGPIRPAFGCASARY